MSMDNKAKDWEETMTKEEVDFIYSTFHQIISNDRDFYNCDNLRAARVWISSQRRRYRRQKESGCCGSYDTIVKKWNEEKQSFDLYMLGFNYGH